MDTNPACKSFLNELCPNGGPLQQIIICWDVLLALFHCHYSHEVVQKKFPDIHI